MYARYSARCPASSDLMDQLEQSLRCIAMEKELTPTTRDQIVSCGESMLPENFSAHLDDFEKKARQAFDILQRIGVNIYAQNSKRASKVMNVSLTVVDSEGNQSVRVLYSAASFEDGLMSKVEGLENKCPIPVNTSAPSSSGVKRKADDTDLPWTLEAIERNWFCDDDVSDQTQVFADDGPWVMCLNDRSVVEAKQQLERAEVAEGDRAPRHVLEEPGHLEMTTMEDFALKNSVRRSLYHCGNSGDPTELVGAEIQVVDNSMLMEFDDGGGDQDWLDDYITNDDQFQLAEAEVRH